MASAYLIPETSFIPHKQCTKCKAWFPAIVEYFCRNSSAPDGLRARCKPCHNAASRVGQREKGKVASQRYRQKNLEKARERDRQWYQRNAKKVRARKLAEYYANAERSQARMRQWRKDHPEQVRTKRRAWAHANPEKARAQKSRRRARKHAASINDFTAAQWIIMQAAYDHRCVYCGKRRKGKLTQDHLTPLSKGGNHTLANIVPACASCNSRKKIGPVLAPVQPLLLVGHYATPGKL